MPLLQSLNATSFTITWGSCAGYEENNMYYVARYGVTNSNEILDSKNISVRKKIFTASSLIPRTMYTFQVALVNEKASRLYFSTLTLTTHGLPCKSNMWNSKFN